MASKRARKDPKNYYNSAKIVTIPDSSDLRMKVFKRIRIGLGILAVFGLLIFVHVFFIIPTILSLITIIAILQFSNTKRKPVEIGKLHFNKRKVCIETEGTKLFCEPDKIRLNVKTYKGKEKVSYGDHYDTYDGTENLIMFIKDGRKQRLNLLIDNYNTMVQLQKLERSIKQEIQRKKDWSMPNTPIK